MFLSIVIPALNEEKTIGIVVRKAVEMIRQLKIEGEVIVADNGSTDQTGAMASRLGARVVTAPERGYGRAIQYGIAAAKGKYILMADADDSYNFEEVEPFIEKLRAGYDLVIGNRYKGKKIKGAMPFLHRYVGTPALTFVMNVLFGGHIGDACCGMRAFSKDAYKRIRCRAPGMEHAVEMIIKARHKKLNITEVPCNLYPDKRDRPPHLKTWHDGWRHLRFMLIFSPFLFFLIPGALLFLLGLAGFVLLPLPVLKLDANHLITSAAFVLIGAQILEFGLAAKAFSYSEYFDTGDRVMDFLRKYFKLEKGLLLGLILAAIGSVILLSLFVTFKMGMLHDSGLRLLRFKFGVAGITCLLLGLQMIFASVLISLFYLKVR